MATVTQIISLGWDPSISGDGTRIAFVSTANLTGGNADANDEIFLYNTTRRSFTQVTTTPASDTNYFPSINADGTRIAFTFYPSGGYGQIVLYNTTRRTSTQLAPGYWLSINANGSRIAHQNHLSVYDAIYVALAILSGATLVTADEKLAETIGSPAVQLLWLLHM